MADTFLTAATHGRTSRGGSAASAMSITSNGAQATDQAGMTQPSVLQELTTSGRALQAQWQLSNAHLLACGGDAPSLSMLLSEDPRQASAVDVVGRTPLHLCVVANSKPCTEALLSAGANVAACDMDGRTALHWAAFHGRLKLAQVLLEHGSDPVAGDAQGRTPLHWATSCKQPKVLEQLIKAARALSKTIDPVDAEHMSPLHFACFHKNSKHAAALIQAGASPVVRDVEGKTPLHWCASSGDAACAKAIVSVASSAVNEPDADGRTPLHLCVSQGTADVVRVLVASKQCNIDAGDNIGRTPLHWAAVIGASNMCSILVKAGADITAKDGHGATPTHYAVQAGSTECISLLCKSLPAAIKLQDESGRTPLMWAVVKDDSAAVDAMCKQRSGIDAQDANGQTALHLACAAGNLPIAQSLVRAKSSLDVQDAAGQTPACLACVGGHSHCVRLLVTEKCNLRLEDHEGKRPIHHAAISGLTDVVELLTHAAQDCAIDEQDQRGETAVHYAAYFGHADTLQALLTSGANLNVQDLEGLSPLHWATVQGSGDCVRILLEFGAYPNLMEFGENKLTPLDYAINAGHDDIASLLVDAGAVGINGLRMIAAVRIQAVFRGHLQRRRFKTVVKDLQARRQDMATALQAVCRGHMARQRVRERLELKKNKSRQAKDEQRLAAIKADEEKERLARQAREEEKTRKAAEAKKQEEELKHRAKREREEREKAKLRQKQEEEEQKRLLQQQAEEQLAEETARRRQQEETLLRRRLSSHMGLAQPAPDLSKVLARQQVRAVVAQKERRRVAELRRSITAARVIQQWWRRVLIARHRQQIRVPHMRPAIAGAHGRPQALGRGLHTTKRDGPPITHRAGRTESRRELVAALTIQLWWRRILADKHARRFRRHQRKKATVRRQSDQTRVKATYGTAQQPPAPFKPKQAPFYSHMGYQGPSPASMSWTQANARYNEQLEGPGRVGRTRPAGVRRRSSIQRTNGRPAQRQQFDVSLHADNVSRPRLSLPAIANGSSPQSGHYSKSKSLSSSGLKLPAV